jgi:hypothetical protein
LECLNNLTLDPACVLGKHVEAHYHYWALNNVERTSLPLDSIISKYCLLLLKWSSNEPIFTAIDSEWNVFAENNKFKSHALMTYLMHEI